MLEPLISTCHRCPEIGWPEPGWGTCVCGADPERREIGVLVELRICPRNLFVDGATMPPTQVRGGVGTELAKMILQLMKEMELPPQQCRTCDLHAAEMDAWGPDRCEAEMGTIVGWLREAAVKRNMPFDDQGGEVLVRMAIEAERGRLAAVQTAGDDNSKGV